MSRFVLTAQLQLQAPNNVAQVVRQIQSQLNNVTVNVQVQGAQQAQRQIQQITQNTNNATTAAERMGRAFAVSVRRFAAFSIATRAVGLFTSTLSDAVQTAIDFERQLVKISQVTGESVSKLSKLTSTITDLSTGLGVSSQSLLEVSTILLQAGLNSKDTEVALKSLARAALAPNFDSITETAEGAIAILAQFQEGVGSLEKQLGSINAVAGAFAVEASDLIDVIRRTGGVFKASGGNLNELLALFTSVRATTRESAESIGTGLRTIFTRIQRPKTIEFLKQFGVELVDLQGKFVGPFEAIKRLSGALAGLGEGDLTFIRVAEELGGFRQIGKVLPLLQQFSTAQAALNVAQKSGNSLAQDAATAQQALAIRITKVKEEFLALVRSVTETATFQIMANTALSLATSLIKLADSIKPLLPLLGALAAIRIARGLGSFLGGIGGGLASARTFNKGGKVHHFARGGMVPGTGNRDTVPAMLSPGEFVIRKSSVQKLGAANLAAMNENRYEDGGPMTMAQKLARARGAQKIQKTESQTKKKKFTSGRDKDELMFSVDPGNIGAFFMNKEGTPDGLKPFKQKTFDITNPKLLSLNGVNPYKNKGDKMAGKPDTFSAKGILQAGQIQTFYPSIGDIQSGSLSQIIQSNVKNKLSEAVMSVANEVSSKKLLDIPPIDSNDALLSSAAKRIQSDAGAIRTTSGYLYEGVIDALTGAKPASGNAVFDFPSSSLQGSRKRLAALFGNETGISKLKQADAKASYSSKIIDGDAGSGSISSKIINSINNGVLSGIKIQKKHFGGLIQKFATGGEVAKPQLYTRGSLVYSIDDMKDAAKRKGISFEQLKALLEERKDNAFRDFVITPQEVAQKFGLLTYKPQDTDLYQKSMAARIEKEDRIESWKQKQGLATRDYEGKSDRERGFLASRQRRRGFATGGGVGTDTVPALLTPGEFVINRSAAQNIGYGALNRMNKVGRYANGGIVQRFNRGGTAMPDASSRYGAGFVGSGGLNSSQNLIPFDMLATQANNLANSQAVLAGTTQQASQSTQQAAQAQQQQAQSATNVIAQNKMLTASVATSLIQGFLPAVDQNSGALTKVAHSLLGLTTTVLATATALEAFGIKLSGSMVADFLGGRGGLIGTSAAKGARNITRSTGQAISGFGSRLAGNGISGLSGDVLSKIGFQITKLGSGITSLSGVVTKIVFGFSQLLGPTLASAAAMTVLNSVISSFSTAEQRKQKAIERGDVDVAGKAAKESAALQNANSLRMAGGTAGGAIGFVLGGPIGAAIGTAIGAGVTTLFATVAPGLTEKFSILFGGNTTDSIVSLAQAQAQATKTQKDFEQGQKDAKSVMEDFSKGTISASEALSKLSNIQKSAEDLQKANNKAINNNNANRSTGGFATARNIFSLGGLLFENANARNSRIDKENEGLNKSSLDAQARSFDITRDARNATIRSALFRGANTQEVSRQLGSLSPEALRKKSEEAAIAAGAAKDDSTREILREQARLFAEQASEVEKSIANLGKEIEVARKQFEALNLGLRGPTGTALAASTALSTFVNSLQEGSIPLEKSQEILQAAFTEAGAALNPDQIKRSISDISGNLADFGADPAQVKKFQENANIFVQAQQKYNTAFLALLDSLEANELRGLNPENFKNEFGKQLADQLGPDVSDEAKKRLLSIIQGANLSQEDIDKIINTKDLSIFTNQLSEEAKKSFAEVFKINEERIKIEKQLIDLTKSRIEAERNLYQAQKEAIDLRMEGREIQGKYGGIAVTNAERRNSILQRANVGAGSMGLSNLNNGTSVEFRKRNAEITRGFADVEARRRTENGLSGTSGVEAGATQQELKAAQKDQIQTIRDLIKVEEDELRIVQEKNKLEKQSLESLISGDIEKFFEQQAAVGATAAIATGNETLTNQFGASALASAFQDIQRQMEAGVQSLYGVRLAGAGGLGEMAAQSALAARGVQSPFAAQSLAGTTPEEEASRARLRDLGGALADSGQASIQMAEMELGTAQMNIDSATLILEDVKQRGINAASGFARGGMVYASRGMFVPRGTDTVPAMLTPGEFVVNRRATQNNLQLLKAINNGNNVSGSKPSYASRGGQIRGGTQYLANGGMATSSVSLDPQLVNNLTNALVTFNKDLATNVTNLQNTKFQIKLETANINVNFQGASFLATLKDQIQKELFGQLARELSNYRVGPGGNIIKSQTVL